MSHSLPSNPTVQPEVPTSQEGWERYRPLIKRLYVDERKTLREVIPILRQHGLKASPRMFKERFKQWGFVKKHKEEDMVAILRKKNERDAVGKESRFRIRDRDVNIQEVFLYFTRKGGSIPRIRIPAAPTPPDINCWTPPAINSPGSTPVSTPKTTPTGMSSSSAEDVAINTPGTAEETERTRSDESSSDRVSEHSQHLAPPNNIPGADLISTAWISDGPFANHEYVFDFELNDIQGFFSDHSRVSHSPTLPQTLLVSENLFHQIRAYFENSCQNMIFDANGNLLTAAFVKLPNDLCNDFDSYCFTATMFIEKGLTVEFRRALSRACALVEQILRAEHPRTLACFLEVLIHLLQTGLPEVTSFLRSYIGQMAAKVTKKGSPWGNICRFLGELDSRSLDQAMAQTWKCTTDTFERELGSFNRLAVAVRLDYIKRVYGSTSFLEEERLLRELLEQFNGIPRISSPRVMLNLAHNLNRQGRHIEAEKLGLGVLSLVREHQLYEHMIVERIESLKIISRSQWQQGNNVAAEQNLRQAISMVVNQLGRMHSWVPEFMSVLEGWLRGWGRHQDADILQSEIDLLMGRDEIDEQQLDGEQVF